MAQAPCYVYAQPKRQNPWPTLLLAHLRGRWISNAKAQDATERGGNLIRVTEQGQGWGETVSLLTTCCTVYSPLGLQKPPPQDTVLSLRAGRGLPSKLLEEVFAGSLLQPLGTVCHQLPGDLGDEVRTLGTGHRQVNAGTCPPSGQRSRVCAGWPGVHSLLSG